MLRLDKVIKPWKESASLNDHINLAVEEVKRLRFITLDR
jgi:hypothetical protein